MTTSKRNAEPLSLERRKVLLGLAAAPLAACAAAGTGVRTDAPAAASRPAKSSTVSAGPGPFPAEGMAAYAASGALKPMKFQRRVLGPKDVAIKLHYCGVCHSDIHMVRGDWGQIQYPLI